MMESVRNLFGRVKRPVLIAGLIVFAVFAMGEIRLLRPVWRQHGGGIWGDSFTYVSFARQLVRGHFFYDHPTAPLIAEHHDGKLVVNGPVWNTSIRPDGRVVYGVAIGYPAFLAAACKLGGTWLMLYANLLLLVAVLALVVLVVWDAMERSLEGLIVACLVAILLPRMDPATFTQFAYPWREPLSYVGILGAAWSVLRFRQTRRFLFLPLAGFLLGLACTVKEANFIYGIWLGLFGLLTPGAVRQRAFWVTAVAASAAFVAGLAPLLIQNALSSGNPFVSLQSVRETSGFSVSQVGPGLRTGNLPETIRNYAIMYGEIPLFRWTPILAVVGMVAALRTVAGRFLLGALAVHLALYLQWGADFRHMFFALIPYTFFVVFGTWWIVRSVIARIAANRRNAATAAVGVCVLLALAAAPRPWGNVLPSEGPILKFRDLNAIVAELESRMPDNAVVLVNRPLRDHWAVYGSRPVVRLHDLQKVGSFTNVYEAIEALRRNGHQLFFVDSTDREPRNHGRIDWSVVDREWLLWRYDLTPVLSLNTVGNPRMRALTDADDLTAFVVMPWSNRTTVVECTVPTGGVTFVRVHPREAGNDLDVIVEGRPVGSVEGCYVPWTEPVTGTTARISVARRSGLPVPCEPSVRLVGWDDPIRQETNPYSDPPDVSWFPDGLRDQSPDARYRSLTSAFRLRVPVRQGPGIFSIASLQVGSVSESEQTFRVQVDGGAVCTGLTYVSPWVPLTSVASNGPGFASFRVIDVPTNGLRLYGVHMHTAWRRLTVKPAKGSALVGVLGGLGPEHPGEGPHAWSSSVDGTPLESGFCGANPFKHMRGAYVVPDPSGRPFAVEWTGSGLVEPVVGQTGPRMKLRLDDSSRAFCESGFHPIERTADACFAWTQAKSAVRVPIAGNARRYRLTLLALGGHPAENRVVTVALGDAQETIRLDDRLRDHVIEFQTPTNQTGMASLTMSVRTWSPLLVLKVPDPRDLGFQFHGLVWEPLPSSAAPPPTP